VRSANQEGNAWQHAVPVADVPWLFSRVKTNCG
jgi:hypothetical protein